MRTLGIIVAILALVAAFVFADELIPEQAEWFGQTGLSPEVERELPRYLRRELGESALSPKSLKAADLKYIGAFDEGDQRVHYWRVPWGTEEVYANVRVKGRTTALGWGNRKPPKVSE